ncbi:MAG: sodium:solute symporter family protein [Bacillota bacterium]
MTFTHGISFALTLLLFTAVGAYSIRLVRTSSDYTVAGRQMSGLMVCTTLVASFVGGTSIIGTSQAAFFAGFSAIWFTVGAGLGSLLLGLGLAQPLREAMVETIPQFLARTYGEGAAIAASLSIVAGMFFMVVIQVLAAVPLLMALYPMTAIWAVTLIMVLIFTYVVLGGFWGASLVGFLKALLLYATVLGAAFYALSLAGGLKGLAAALPPGVEWFGLMPKGIGTHGAEIFSVVVGFSSSQSYLQVIFAGKDAKASRMGAFGAALLFPLIGLASTVLGMFIRVAHPEVNPAGAVPFFFLNYFSPWLGGVALAGLLVSLVVTGASQLLGIATTLVRDIYQSRFRPFAGDPELLLASRIFALLTAAAVYIFCLGALQSLILHWAYFGAAIRGVAAFLPLVFAVFFPRFVTRGTGYWAILLAPFVVLFWPLVPLQINPLYPGLLVSFLLLSIGVLTTYRSKSRAATPGQAGM